MSNPGETPSDVERGIRESAEWMIEQGYLIREWRDGEEWWTLTEKGRDYMARLQEHEEG